MIMSKDKISWQALGNDQYCLSGCLERDTVPAFWLRRKEWMPDSNKVSLDLGGLSRVDSAGMVMLLHLHQQLSSAGCDFTLLNVPEQLKTLLRLSHVEPILATCMK
ncbi:STAS domain-containing protein [Photobacterium leiognathi]|uniref:STAS domain-containing protein n=1 Tax=Photobacterium leiognathi TaxID=553611 RepID=UPI0027374D46|nr:STAS domain-containing protein [Photobacterium leiognathi]